MCNSSVQCHEANIGVHLHNCCLHLCAHAGEKAGLKFDLSLAMETADQADTLASIPIALYCLCNVDIVY